MEKYSAVMVSHMSSGSAPIPSEGAKERIWRIRDTIQSLEDAKEKVIALVQGQQEMQESTRKMWIGDAKETYYSVVAAWQMLDACLHPEPSLGENPAESARNLLARAKSSLLQSASELRSINGLLAIQLEADWKITFAQCEEQILRELVPFLPKKEPHPLAERVVKISDTEYHLPCAACGETCVVFRVGVPTYSNQQRLLLEGIVASQSLDVEHAKPMFDHLAAGNLKGAHEYVKTHQSFEGIDAYCPDCDAAYCRDHYALEEVYDDGFYDCTYGTCPNKHRRIIDD